MWDHLSLKDLLIIAMHGNNDSKIKAQKKIKTMLCNVKITGDMALKKKTDFINSKLKNKNTKYIVKNNKLLLNKLHKNKTNIGKCHPLNGCEPEFFPLNWNYSKKRIENNNCYAYAINSLRDSRIQKSVPGIKRKKFLKNLSHTHNYLECDKLWDEIKGDLGNMCNKIGLYDKAPPDTYKAIMVVSPNNDFHFYRQDNDGTFSHKRGWAYNPSKLDAKNKIIFDPVTCDRNYGDLNYSKVCFAFTVPIHIEFGI